MATTAPPPSEVSGARLASRLEECGDETLAHLVAQADEAAFAVLYERHCQALYRYCRSIVRHDLDAQDALQTAWTSALIALRRGRRDAPVRPWLYRIVHNEAISVLRRRRRSEPSTHATASGAASAEDHAIDRERFELLVADLRQLPDRPRGALLMRELNGLSHEEIAAALETSVAAAKQCVYEARRHLADFAAGRQTPCDEICRSISDGDRRVLRGRRVMAHLRDCPGCAAFASTIDQRRGALHALTPWIAAPAAITVLDRVLHAGWGAGSGTAAATVAGASSGAGAAGASGGASLGGGTAGATATTAATTAAPAAVAGGVVTKAISLPLIGKALIAAAAVTAGAVSVSVPGSPHHRAAHRGSVTPVPAAPIARGGSAGPRALRPAPRSRPHAPVVAARHAAQTSAPRRSTKATAGAPGRAGRAAGARAPGQSRKAPRGALSPGQAKKSVPAAVPPGQARKAHGALPPGQAKKAGGAVAPGQAKKAGGAVPPGQAKKASLTDPPGQTKHASSAATGRSAAPASPAVATAAATPAPPSSPAALAGSGTSSPGKSGDAHSK